MKSIIDTFDAMIMNRKLEREDFITIKMTQE